MFGKAEIGTPIELAEPYVRKEKDAYEHNYYYVTDEDGSVGATIPSGAVPTRDGVHTEEMYHHQKQTE